MWFCLFAYFVCCFVVVFIVLNCLGFLFFPVSQKYINTILFWVFCGFKGEMDEVS